MTQEMTLYDQWMEIKEMEAQCKQKRYEIEEKIAKVNNYDMECGKSKSYDVDNYNISFTGRRERKVQYAKLKELQKKLNIPQEDIERIFRMKAEVNVAEYKKLISSNKQIFSTVIEESLKRSSFKITPKEQDNG